jgi:hypothetical protein
MSILNESSILDTISDSISPVLRRLSDIQANVSGSATQLLRIYKVVKPYYKQRNNIQQKSVLGDWKERLESKVLANVRIQYPFNKIEIFQSKYENGTNNVLSGTPMTGIDLLDILPIEGELIFEGEYEKDPVFLNKSDKIIDVFFDENQNAVPIVLEITKFLGDFFGKSIVSKKIQLGLYRGALPSDMKPLVDEYIAEQVAKKKEIRAMRF